MEAYQNPALPPKQRAADLLARMTLREKVGQVNQRLYGFAAYTRTGDEIALTEECLAEITRWGGLGVVYGYLRADPWSGKTFETGIPPGLGARAYNLLQKQVLAASRLGIPVLHSSECAHGHQALGGYLLPVNPAAGATFDPPLLRRAYALCARQLKAQGVDMALLSSLDVLRDPRWGRSEECYGEDPFLCAQMAGAVVAGVASAGVEPVAKHLCAQGETTGGINASPARIGPRELREIHLPPVQAAIRAGASGVMAAYNEIDGVPCHASKALLRGWLRGEQGFGGIVMADGTALDRLDEITGSNVLSGALGLASGVDVSLWDTAFTHLEEAVQAGHVDENLLDEAVLRVLEMKFRRGLFEHPYMDEKVEIPEFSHEENPESTEIALQSAVLLKNKNNLLPLKAETAGEPGKPMKIAVIGPNADDIYNQLGDYTPPIKPETGVTLREGLRRNLPPGAALEYARGCGILRGDEIERREAGELCARSDVVVLALGGSSNRFGGVRFDINGAALPGAGVEMDCGEGVDVADLRLPACQLELLAEIKKTGKPVITVVVAGRPYAVGEVAAQTDALLYAFYPGPRGGEALARLIFGAASPAGRLPAGLPGHAGQLPVWYNKKYAAKQRDYVDMPAEAAFPFGSGFGYGALAYGAPAVHSDDAGISLAVNVKNTGNRDDWAVPMLFIRWKTGTTTARRRELKAFTKQRLAPGQQAELHLHIPAGELWRWDAEMNHIPGAGPLALMLEDGAKERWNGEVER